MTYRSPTLADIIATLKVDRVDDHRFVATQLDNPVHHIVGGHIAGQALMAASLTAPGRRPHSVHVYYVRAGDAREPVDFHVEVVRDGGTLSTRQITARQNDQILLEALASFSVSLESRDYHQSMPDVADPDSLPPVQEQLARYAEELGGHWVRSQPFDMRYVDAPPRLAIEMPEAPARMRMWWRPNGSVPADDVLHSCLLTYLSGTTMVEVALAQRRATPLGTFNALIDHALWFHRPVDLSDWVLSDQVSPSGVGGRRSDDVNDVQPRRSTGLHRDPGTVLRARQQLSGVAMSLRPLPAASTGHRERGFRSPLLRHRLCARQTISGSDTSQNRIARGNAS